MSVAASRHSYRPVAGWGDLPDGMTFGDIGGIAVDSRDRIYVFSRSAHPMVVLDADGRLLDTWGQGVFTKPHGLHIGPDDTLYCTDDGDHTVRRFTTEGRLLMQIGTTGQGSGFMSGKPLNRPTHTALSPKGELYVSDGYGNARVHKFAPDGRLILSWGEPGTGPGEFNIPHNVICDAEGRV